jgi:DNA mismatch repair ATPase MutS
MWDTNRTLYCPQGQRLVSRWLQQPLRDAARLSERQDCVEALSQDLAAMDSLSKDYLRGVPDLPALARKLHRKKTTLQDLYRFVLSVQECPVSQLDCLQDLPGGAQTVRGGVRAGGTVRHGAGAGIGEGAAA